MALMTSIRSIDFSRATASAICSNSSLFALTPCCAISKSLQSFAVMFQLGTLIRAVRGLGHRQKIVVQNELCIGNQVGGQSDHLRLVEILQLHTQPDLTVLEPVDHAAKAAAAVDHLGQLD